MTGGLDFFYFKHASCVDFFTRPASPYRPFFALGHCFKEIQDILCIALFEIDYRF